MSKKNYLKQERAENNNTLSVQNENNPKELVTLPEGVKVPDTFKFTRAGQFKVMRAQRDLFSEIEDKEEGFICKVPDEFKPTKENLLSCQLFFFAARQILYNQSFLMGNSDVNSGTRRVAYQDTGKFGGLIQVTITELCKIAHATDKPDKRQKELMRNTIETQEQIWFRTQNDKGEYEEQRLCNIVRRIYGKNDKTTPKGYILMLHPEFANSIKNYGELPQDSMKRLSEATERITPMHLDLLDLLAIQRKDQPFVRYIDELLKLFGLMEDYYKNQRKRIDSNIFSACEAMIKMGIIESYKPDYILIRKRQCLNKITFYFPKDKGKTDGENVGKTTSPEGK